MPGVALSALHEPTYSFLTAQLRSGCGYYLHFTDKETETREAKSFTQGQRKSLPSLPHCDPMNGEGEFGSSYTHWHLTPCTPSLALGRKTMVLARGCWRGPGAPFSTASGCQATLTGRPAKGLEGSGERGALAQEWDGAPTDSEETPQPHRSQKWAGGAGL